MGVVGRYALDFSCRFPKLDIVGSQAHRWGRTPALIPFD
jgi:hypothetical protein